GPPQADSIEEAYTPKANRGRPAIATRIRPAPGRQPAPQIPGLTTAARYSQPKDEPPPQFFVPYRQHEKAGTLNFYVRSTERVPQLLASLHGVLSQIDPTVPVENLRPLADQVDDTMALDRLIGTLSSGFALLATLLAAIGLY